MADKDAQRLGLFFECHQFVLCLDITHVERLVLADELVETSTSAHGATRLVRAGAQTYAAFNLGRLLGMPPTDRAGVLVRTVFAGGELRFCLETGPCLLVRPMGRSIPLGPGLFRARRRALEGAFAIDDVLRQGAPHRASVGFTINVDGLLAVAERDAAAKAIRQATKERAATSP